MIRRAIQLSSILLIGLSGCADLFGLALGVKPGDTISPITASENQVVLEYTHSYDWEFPAAGRYADAQCSRYGKRAELVSIVQQTQDRSIATFRCN